MSRKLLYAAGAVVLLLLILVVVLPLLIDVNSYRPKIEAAMTQALGRNVALGNIHLSIFSGGVAVDDVDIADDPAFSGGPFMKAKSITVRVELMPLIFSHALNVTGFTVEQPEVNLLRTTSGKWNFSTLGANAAHISPKDVPRSAATASAAAPASSEENISVSDFRIHDGKLIIGTVGGTAKRREYDQLEFEISNLSTTTQFPFTFSAQAPGNGTIKLSGKAGPLDQANVQKTPLDATLEVHGLDLTFTGFADPASGIAGVVDFTGSLTADGSKAHSKGTMKANKLQLVPGSSPATETVEVDYDTDYQMEAETGKLNQCDVHLGKALAQMAGTYNTSGAVASVEMMLTGKSMPVTELEGVLPAVGVAMPKGASLKDGTLDANLSIAGPMNALVIAGPANFANVKLSGFDLGSKMGALSSFAGVPKSADTVIQTFSSDLRVAQEGIRADKINIVVQGIGALNGSGTVSPDHALDFKMAAQLTGGTGALGALSKIVGGSGGKGLPFLIKGTTTDPQFVPDVGGLAGGLAGGLGTGIGKGALGGDQGAASGVQSLGGALGGLLGGKKK